MGRKNIKCSPETFDQLNELRPDGESWDQLLQRAVEALGARNQAGDPIAEYRNATVWAKCDDGTKSEGGRTEIYPNWVRVRGLNGVWIPREQVEQLHER